MDPIQSFNHNPMQEAHEAPRCQHIRMNGRRCGSPALRGEDYCYFHDSVENPSGSYSLPFPEDATSLQYGVMMVIRMLISGHVEIKRCWALLYALQIASANLRAFAAERAEREGLTSDKTARQPQAAGDQKNGGDLNPQSGRCSHATAERERFQRGAAEDRHSRGLPPRAQASGDGLAAARRQSKDGERRWSAPATAAVELC